MVFFISRGQDFALVDIIHPQRFQDLRFDKVADARLCHHRNRDRIDNPFDHIGIAHARHTALHADISRHPFQRHHSDRAGVFGDSRLLRRDHIHDDATLEHLCQTTFYLVGTFLAAILLMSIASHVIPLFFVNTTINTTDGYPTPSASKSLCPMHPFRPLPENALPQDLTRNQG